MMQAVPEPKPEPEKKSAKLTRYVVLKREQFRARPGDSAPAEADEMTTAWVNIGASEAQSDTAAILKVVGSEHGTFVAVPARSWRPRGRKTKTIEKNSWE